MKKLCALYISFSILVLVSLATSSAPTFADGSCLPLNNGGPTTRQMCLTSQPSNAPTANTNQQDNQQQNNQSQDTNSQPVYPTSKAKSTPNTGPGDWSLLGLVAAGVVGFYIRKKTAISLDKS